MLLSFNHLQQIMILEKMQQNELLEGTSENMVELTGATFGWDVIEAESAVSEKMRKKMEKNEKRNTNDRSEGVEKRMKNGKQAGMYSDLI